MLPVLLHHFSATSDSCRAGAPVRTWLCGGRYALSLVPGSCVFARVLYTTRSIRYTAVVALYTRPPYKRQITHTAAHACSVIHQKPPNDETSRSPKFTRLPYIPPVPTSTSHPAKNKQVTRSPKVDSPTIIYTTHPDITSQPQKQTNDYTQRLKCTRPHITHPAITSL